MMSKRLLFSAVAVGLLAGCATAYQPMVDTRGADMRYYGRDLQECRYYASSRVNAEASVGISAIGGAGLGAIIGDNRDAVVVGALLGALAGKVASDQKQAEYIRECLLNRGYNVVN